jgi:uncharacterized protein (TIGR03118 family)
MPQGRSKHSSSHSRLRLGHGWGWSPSCCITRVSSEKSGFESSQAGGPNGSAPREWLGLVHGPGTPWWISDNNSGWSTLYDGSGKQVTKLKVLIPTAGNGPSSPTGLNGPGSPTGTVFNGSSDFQVQGGAALFLFATLDGTISGWAQQSNFNEAILAVDNSANKAVYTGLAITSRTSGNLLYAADQANGKVDIYDANFAFVKSFTDTTLPAGFAPFGIQASTVCYA